MTMKDPEQHHGSIVSNIVSNIVTRPIKDFDAILGKEPPKNKIPDILFPTKALIAMFGVRGSGKSVACTTMLKKYKELGFMQRLFVICPTYQSNKHLYEGLDIAEEDLFEDATQDSLDKVMKAVADDGKLWREWKEACKVYREYKQQERAYLAGRRKEIDVDLLLEAVDCGVADLDEPPEYKYGKAAIPELWLVLDDCQSSPLFNQNTRNKNNLSHVLIQHRHVGARLGLNVVILLQNFKNQVGTLARAMRMNLTAMMIWGYRDVKLLDDIYTEIGREVTEEEFYQLFDYATSGERFNAFVVEFGAKVRFRRNLNEFISVANLPKKSDETITDGVGTIGEDPHEATGKVDR